MTTMGTNRPWETISFHESTTMIFSVSALWANSLKQLQEDLWENADIGALECKLEFCTKSFQSAVQSGSLLETSQMLSSSRLPDSWHASDPIKPPNKTYDALYEPFYWSVRSDLAIYVPPSVSAIHKFNQVNVSQAAVDSLSAYLSSFWSSNPQLMNNSGAIEYNAGPIRATDPLTQALWSSNDPNMTFTRLALSITNNIRANSDKGLQFSGDESQVITLIQARPEWLAIPAICVVLGTIFVIATIVRTRNGDVPLWKNEILPVLLSKLEAQKDDQSGPTYLVVPNTHAMSDVVHLDVRLRTHVPSGEFRLLSQTSSPSDWYRSSTSSLYHCTKTSTVSSYNGVSTSDNNVICRTKTRAGAFRSEWWKVTMGEA